MPNLRYFSIDGHVAHQAKQFASFSARGLATPTRNTPAPCVEILGNPDLQDESKLRAALEKYGIRMTRPIGFNNSYVIGMRKDIARERGITKIFDLARQSNADLLFGFTNEFMNWADGWPALREKYGLPQQARGLEHSLTYPALQKGSLHTTDAYATDAEIAKYDLQLLDDDLHVLPPYDAVLLYRADVEQRAPEAVFSSAGHFRRRSTS